MKNVTSLKEKVRCGWGVVWRSAILLAILLDWSVVDGWYFSARHGGPYFWVSVLVLGMSFYGAILGALIEGAKLLADRERSGWIFEIRLTWLGGVVAHLIAGFLLKS